MLENLYRAQDLLAVNSLVATVFDQDSTTGDHKGPHTIELADAEGHSRVGLRSPGGAIAWLSPEYLWANLATLPYQINICVFSSAGAMLFCSTQDHELAANVKREVDAQTFGNLSTDIGDQAYQIASWELFLASGFRSDSWKIVAFQSEQDTIGPFQFGRLVAALIVLAMATAVLFSLVHLRRRLTPLEALTKATRSMALQDFDVELEISTGDEFQSLADSFKEMARRLKLQFTRLSTEAELDQLILTAPSVDPVIERFLESVEVFTSCDSFCVGVVDFNNPKAMGVWASKSLDERILPVLRHEFSEQERQQLQDATSLLPVQLNANEPGLLAPLAQLGAQHALMMSISRQGELLGFLASGYNGIPPSPHEVSDALKDVRDRLAVALSSAEKDESLFVQAHYDALTGLPNRFLLMDRLHQEFSRAQRNLSLMGVLFIDLDRFKNVNDSLGHAQGDILLKEVARRLKKLFRDTDTVARLGGDEYVILLPDADNEEHIGEMADRVLGSLNAPVNLDGSSVYVNASIGISVFPGDGNSPDELLTNADTAMYRSKEKGRAQKSFFTEELNVAVRKRLDIESKLRDALADQQFAMVYQPQLCLREGTLTGVEALIRWPDSDYGPNDFIPVAEDSGLINEIGQWALDTACAEFASIPPSIRPQRISINVSARQLKTLDYSDRVLDTLRRHGISPRQLDIEITESVLLDDLQDARRAIRDLGKAGVSLALDDFGTGYSSLRYLQQLPIESIKVDKGFTKGIGVIAEDEVLVRSVIHLSRVLGKRSIVEGVETAEQLEFLRLNDCDAAQGFLISRPLKLADYQAFLVDWNQQQVFSPTREQPA